jgi:hypothetical protein
MIPPSALNLALRQKSCKSWLTSPKWGMPSANPDAGYQGSSGTRYQYDMNNPSDSNRYSTDLNAQRRDQMNLDTRRNLDRGLGQKGGGIYGND